MSVRPAEAGSIKEGNYIVIDGEPCKVVEVEKSKTGKHGSAKVRIVGIGLFDGVKRTLVVPADAQVEIPVINKRTAQVIAILGDTVQLMDLTTYQTYEIPMPDDPEIKEKLAPGVEVEVWEAMGKMKIVRVLK